MDKAFKIPLATLLPGSTAIDGKSRVRQGFIWTEAGEQKHAVVKVLNARTIAVEAVCALLGRYHGLPIPQPYFVDIKPNVIPELELPKTVLGFALEYMDFPSVRIRNLDDIEPKLQNWEFLFPVIVFDLWVANEDRTGNNLLFDGGSCFTLIDHGESFPGHLESSTPVRSELLNLVLKDASELDRHRLRNELLRASSNFETTPWDELIHAFQQTEILPECEPIAKDLVSFLQSRLVFIRKILTYALGIRQAEIDVPKFSNISDERKQ